MIEKMKSKKVLSPNRLVLKATISSIFMVLFLGLNLQLQAQCTDCQPCVEGGPCCNVWNACNYNQSNCTYADCIDPTDLYNGCDMTCTPIDSGILFLLLGGAAFGGVMLARRKVAE